jgi:hypothetical protein
MMASVALLLLLFLEASAVFAQSEPPLGPRLSEDEYRIRDLELKARAIEVESIKAKLSLWATGIPITVGLLTLAGSIWAARKTVISQFTTKAAELALQGEGPDEIIHRAKLLAELYEGLLPKDTIRRLDELDREKIGRIVTQAPWLSDLKKEAVTLLAQNPAQREQIIADYISMFPTYQFFKPLLSRLQVAAETKPEHKA